MQATTCTRLLRPIPSTNAPPDPRKTFHEVARQLRRFYDAPDDVIVLLVLYIVLTYLHDKFDAVAYLQVVGEPATGKTRLGELLEILAFKARLVARMSVPAVYRFIMEMKGTLIVDEQGAGKREMRDILNAGYKKSGRVMLVSPQGDLLEFPCFGPKVLIANDPELNEALESRLLTIVSQAAKRPLDRFLLGPAERELAPVVSMLDEFARTYGDDVAAEYENLPEVDGLSDRDFDLAAPLLAIAKVIDRAPGTPSVYPMIEAHLVALARKRKENRATTSESVIIARIIIEFAAVEHHDARRNPPPGEKLFLAEDLFRYANESELLPKRRFRSVKAMAERLNVLGLIADKRVVDVDPECAPELSGRLRRRENAKRPRIQRTVYAFDMARARELAGEDVRHD